VILEEIIQKSEIILIKGQKKYGKLTFALYETNGEKTLIFSTYQKSIFLKRLSAVANFKDEKIQTVLSDINYLTLKEDWLENKIKYGYDFILEDIKRAIKEKKPKNIIFHRLDVLFTSHLNDNIALFMEKLINIKDEYEVKIFITITSNETNENIVETIEDFSDLNIEIKHEKERLIYIQNSLFPVTPDKYSFRYKDDKFEIVPIDQSAKKSKYVNFLLITDKNDLINLHKYIFSRKGFSVDIATSMTDTINKILTNPDIIIYNPKNEELDLSICETIKEKQLKSKLIYIPKHSYVRTEDKMRALNAGCYEMFPLNFSLGEYIIEIEKMLGIYFYTPILNKLPNNKVVTTIKHFCEIIDSLYNEKIYFTLIKFSYNIPLEMLKNKLRKTDIIFYDKQSNSYILALINLRQTNISPVINKLFNNNTIDYLSFEAAQWEEKKEEICK